MNLKDCFEKRLLRRIEPNLKKSLRAIEISEKKLKRAEIAFSEK